VPRFFFFSCCCWRGKRKKSCSVNKASRTIDCAASTYLPTYLPTNQPNNQTTYPLRRQQWCTRANPAAGAACAKAGGSRYVVSCVSTRRGRRDLGNEHSGVRAVPPFGANCSQCDEKRPICGNCKKSRRECPGFPDEFDLVFRDENKAMERKARKTSGPTSSTDGSSSQSCPLQ
jgi:hypothetical protein